MILCYVKEEDLRSMTQEEFDAMPPNEKRTLVQRLQFEVIRLKKYAEKAERMKLIIESIGVFYETYERELK